MNRKVVLYGAAGHTGRFIAEELVRQGFTPILAGRDMGKLAPIAGLGAEIRQAEVTDPAALDAMLSGADLLINAAGPFGDTSPPLIEAALRAGIPYLDITAEPFVTQGIFDSFGSREAQSVVAPAFGFFGALGDLLVSAALGDWASADEVDLGFALDRWQPTKGTLLAGKRRAGRRLVWAGGRLETREPADQTPKGSWDFAQPFGTQPTVGEFSTVDVVTISRHVDVRTISTCINEAPLSDLANAAEPLNGASGPSEQQFLIEAVVRRGSEKRRASASGRDIYAVTAPIIVEAARWILDGRSRATGVVAPAELFEPRAFLTALPSQAITIRLP